MTADEPPPLIAALRDPDLYDYPVDHVELVETHISWILLTGRYAFKIKKPVDLGFVDFSTLARREHYCREEVRLNRRLAPDVYLDVQPIGGALGQPHWGERPAIEYAVRMRQFARSAQLDRVLQRGELRAEHIDAFARTLAAFHDEADVAGPDAGFGNPEQIGRDAEDNFATLREAVDAPELLERIESLARWSAASFRASRGLFEARRLNGRVREGHGDLHLRNLAWLDESPLVFDCIEFNERLRWIDVINDIAFLIMDLEARDRNRLAVRFLNRYLEGTGDYSGLSVLRFYLVYRAMVRAKVAAIRAGQSHAGAADRDRALRECGDYLRLAARCTRPGEPRLILTRGVSASGKSTWSLPVAEALGAIRIRSDRERKRLFGMPADARGADRPGEGIYTPEAGRRTYERLLELAEDILDAGYPVVVDAAALKEAQRTPFRRLAARKRAAFSILQFHAPVEVLRERIGRRPSGVSDADRAVLEHQLNTLEPLSDEEQGFVLRVDTGREVELRTLLSRIDKAAVPE